MKYISLTKIIFPKMGEDGADLVIHPGGEVTFLTDEEALAYVRCGRLKRAPDAIDQTPKKPVKKPPAKKPAAKKGED